MKRFHKILLSLLTGLLMALSWPERGFAPLILIALIPLLVVEHLHWQNKEQNTSYGLLAYSFPAFLVFNAITTYWIYNSTLSGAIFAVLFDTTLFTLVFHLFHVTRRNLAGSSTGYIALLGYWLSLEFTHHRWEFNFPWLSLGNVFGAWPSWIQWYEFTGIEGGTLWILGINILLFFFVRDRILSGICSKSIGIRMALTVLLFLLPLAWSLITYYTYEEKKAPVDVVVVQPNLDPYSEQYELDPAEVTDRLLKLALSKTDSLTDFVVCPESAIQEYIFEDRFKYSPSVNEFRNLKKRFPHIRSVVGLSSRKFYAEGEPLSHTARKFRDADRYYDSYNTALYIDNDSTLQVYHKSKLTPGVEIMPYGRYLKFLEKYALDLGGTVGSLGTDPGRKPFRVNDTLKIAPVICYESVYGEYLNSYVRNGANLIFVITNDGWWGNTPGHRQHLLFSSIRAIETRRSIARSANTGISCFINQRGDLLQRTAYWEPAAIRGQVNANDKITFYVRYGDYISRAGGLAAILMALLTLANFLRRKTARVQFK